MVWEAETRHLLVAAVASAVRAWISTLGTLAEEKVRIIPRISRLSTPPSPSAALRTVSPADLPTSLGESWRSTQLTERLAPNECENWGSVQGKCSVEPNDVEAISKALLRLGIKDVPPAPKPTYPISATKHQFALNL